MIRRRLKTTIESALQQSPAVALIGPRQVGKTTLALDIGEKRSSVYLDLENPLDLQKVSNIDDFHEANRDKLIILDEVQRTPEIFTSVRGIIDRERRRGNKSGQFLFLGPASIELLQQSSESLAGRIAYLELFPVDLLEFAGNSTQRMNQLWVRGGFPESLLAESDNNSLSWRLDFIRTYLERDIPLLGPRIPARALERLWTMLAHNQGTLLNTAVLARNLEVSSPTINRYLDLMVDLLLVRRLQPWASNVGKRLVKAPKVFVRDSGITHALLNIGDYNELLGHPVMGGSWEGFVIENILSVLPPRVLPFFYRSPGGAEIDLILEFSGKEKWAIEVKRKAVPAVSKGFYVGCEDIKADERYVVYSGEDSFSLGSDVTAIPLYQLMKKLEEKSR